MGFHVNKTFKKKAQIFMFDLIFSTIIIFVSLGIYFSYYTSTSQNNDIYDLNNQILTSLTNTRINDLNGEDVTALFRANLIKNIENTVGQQIAEYYYTDNLSLARNLSRVFVKDYVTKQFNLNLTLNNGSDEIVMFEAINRDITFENSEVASVSSRLIFGYINLNETYGPYTFEIKLWQ